MNLGILGSGAREHALQWSLKRNNGVDTVFALPGNGGTSHNVPVDASDIVAVRQACDHHGIDLLIVGPEGPLASGIVDAFDDHPTRVFGPTRAAARLESSKVWSKTFMQRHGIPTAPFALVDSCEAWTSFAGARGNCAVLKADGLAGGKGVSVCRSADQLEPEWARISALRPAGETYIAEAILDGWELSIHVLTDGKTWSLFPSSQDHKPLLDGDQGPNTGGMGAVSPVPACTQALLQQIETRIVAPTLRGLAEESIPYTGFLYFGLMITPDGPFLLEYNVRLGDPETQVLLPALTSDLLPALVQCLDGRLASNAMTFGSQSLTGIVLASPGYPSSPRVGQPIKGLQNAAEDALLFHAGTARRNDGWITSGGRVISVVGRGDSLERARTKAYAACEAIQFDGMQWRADIGQRTNR